MIGVRPARCLPTFHDRLCCLKRVGGHSLAAPPVVDSSEVQIPPVSSAKSWSSFVVIGAGDRALSDRWRPWGKSFDPRFAQREQQAEVDLRTSLAGIRRRECGSDPPYALLS